MPDLPPAFTDTGTPPPQGGTNPVSSPQEAPLLADATDPTLGQPAAFPTSFSANPPSTTPTSAGFDAAAATSPAPTPLAATVTAADRQRRIALLAKAYPQMSKSPAALVALAAQPVSDEELLGNVGASLTAAQAATQASLMADLTNPGAAWARWSKYTPQAQQAIIAAGGVAPQKPQSSGGLLGHLIRFAKSIGEEAVHPSRLLTENPLVNPMGALHDQNSPLAQGVATGGLAVHDVTHPLISAFNDIAERGPLKGVVGGIEKVPGEVTNVVPHLWRVGTYDPNTGGAGGTSWAGGFADFGQAWKATAPGQPFYFNETLRQGNALLGEGTQANRFAQYTAEHSGDMGQALTAMLGKNPDPKQAQALLNQAQTDPNFAKAVQVYSTGGASFGRSIALKSGLRPGSQAYSQVSGAADAAMAWYTNPLNVAGKVNSAVKAARVIPAGSISDALQAARLTEEEQAALKARPATTDQGYLSSLAQNFGTGQRAGQQRWAQALADHVNDGNFTGWAATQPRAAAAWDHFNSYVHASPTVTPGAATANDVLDWMHSTSGLDTIAKGELGSYLNGADAEIPTLTRIGLDKVRAKVALTPVSNLATTAEQMDVPLDHVDLVGTQGRFAGAKNLLGDFAYRTVKNATTPMSPKVIPLVGAESPGLFSRYVDQFTIPTAARNQLVNAFANATGAAARREIVAEATRVGLYQMGWGATDEGKNLVESFANNLRTVYTGSDEEMLADGSGRKASLTPDTDTAMAVGVPDLRQLWTAARGANLLGVTKGFLTSPQLETLMHKYWAPAALGRLGFVPRVVSEEWLTALGRLKPSEIGTAYGTDQLGRAAQKAGEYGIADEPAGTAWRAKLGRTLIARMAGVSDQVGAQRAVAEQTGAKMGEARNLMQANAQANRDLMRAIRDEQKVRAKTGSALTPEVTQAQDRILALKDEASQIAQRMAADPIIQSAEARGLFRSRGGYVDPAGINPSLGTFDPNLGGLATVKMRGHWRTVANHPGETVDPAFIGAAADYYARLGSSPLARSALNEMARAAPDDATEAQLARAFDGTVTDEAMNRDDRLMSLRQAHADLRPDTQAALGVYAKALSTGNPLEELKAGINLGALRDEPGVAAEEQSFLKAVIGDAYRPTGYTRDGESLADLPASIRRQAERYLADPNGPRADILLARLARSDPANTTVTEGGSRLSADALASIAAPVGPVLRGRRAILAAGRKAAVEYAHSDEFAPFLPHSDHANTTAAGPIADPVAAGNRRLYYPATTPDWQPSGQLRLGDVTDRQLMADLARTVLAPDKTAMKAVEARLPVTHKPVNGSLWATEDPARALAVAKHLAGDQARVGFVDVANEEADAQALAGTKVAAGGRYADSRYLGQLEKATSAERDRMRSIAPGLPPDGYRLTAPQMARGDVFNADGPTMEDGIFGLASRLASHLHNTFAPRGRFNHRVASDLLSQDPKTLRLTGSDLRGIPLADMPEAVPAEQEMALSSKNVWQRMNQTYYDRIVGPAIDSVVRQPLYQLNYMKGLRAWRGMVEPRMVDPGLRAWGTKTASLLKATPAELRQALAERTAAQQWAEDHPGVEPDELTPQMSPYSQDLLNRMDALHANAKEPGAPERTQAWADMEDRVDDAAHQAAGARALNDTIPFVNDHTTRSNMSMWVRNLAPFYWAQESFFKRWARALRYNPATLSRLELGIHGLASMGVVHKDQYGNDVVTIPGTAELTRLLGDVGMKHIVPSGVPMTMEVKMLTPGFNRTAAPAFGPLLSVPFSAVASKMPELQSADATITGYPPSSANPFLDMYPAGWARNVMSAFLPSLDKSQWASAQLQAMQMLAANGMAPGAGATPEEAQQFNDRTRNWTRNILLARAMLGFVTPATPALSWGDNKVGGQRLATVKSNLDAYLQAYGLNDGLTKFVGDYPDATPYTVFATTSAGEASAPATQAALDALDTDPGFYKANPAAAAYLLPQAPGDFSSLAYNQEVAAGIRQRKDMTSIADELATASVSNVYYQARTNYLQALAQVGGNSADKRVVQSNWSQWSSDFLAANPLFAQELTTGNGHTKRLDALNQMRTIIASGRYPSTVTGQVQAVGGMVDLFDQWTEARDSLAGRNDSGSNEERKQIDAEMASAAANYIAENPGAALFYQRVIVPEIAQTDSMLGKNLEAVSQ